MSTEIAMPFQQFTDNDGSPLENGYIYVGPASLNPVTNPISVFWDVGLTIPAAQPVRTIAGYPSRNGNPSRLYVGASEYSISVHDKNSVLAYSALNNAASDEPLRQELAGPSGADMIGYGSGTVADEFVDIRTGLTTQNIEDMTNVACWGDSLTEGVGGGFSTYPLQFGLNTGYITYNGGVGGDTSSQILTRFNAAPERHSHLTIIWAGRNNYTDPTTVKADIAAMVAGLGHDGYLVMGVINGDFATEYIGQPGHTTITTLNSDLAALYGSHFVDIRARLVAAYNSGIPQDVIDHANDIPPSSLRSDQIHLNAAGYQFVAGVLDEIAFVTALRGTRGEVVTSDKLAEIMASPPLIGTKAPQAAQFVSVTAQLLNVGGRLITISGDLTSLQAGANWIPDADATRDIGYSPVAFRWRNGYFSGAVQAVSLVGDSLQLGSGIVQPSGSGNEWHINKSWLPLTDSGYSIGTAGFRWSVIYSSTGTINTSDAREKTAVRPLNEAEIAAAKQLAQEIGVYRWLSAVEEKGDSAREHIGMTVQRAIEVLEDNGLDPFGYGFICHDSFEGGDRYGFRVDELLAFVARGQAAHLQSLESRLAALESI